MIITRIAQTPPAKGKKRTVYIDVYVGPSGTTVWAVDNQGLGKTCETTIPQFAQKVFGETGLGDSSHHQDAKRPAKPLEAEPEEQWAPPQPEALEE
jgi:hypothetical protein